MRATSSKVANAKSAGRERLYSISYCSTVGQVYSQKLMMKFFKWRGDLFLSVCYFLRDNCRGDVIGGDCAAGKPKLFDEF
jgi:hypothetical protein